MDCPICTKPMVYERGESGEPLWFCNDKNCGHYDMGIKQMNQTCRMVSEVYQCPMETLYLIGRFLIGVFRIRMMLETTYQTCLQNHQDEKRGMTDMMDAIKLTHSELLTKMREAHAKQEHLSTLEIKKLMDKVLVLELTIKRLRGK